MSASGWWRSSSASARSRARRAASAAWPTRCAPSSTRLGLEVEEDDSAAETGSDAGNVLARIPGPEGARTVLLCAHIDTVPLAAPVEVARDDGLLTNRHEAILGADNKAAVATILAAARRLAARRLPRRAWSCCSPPARSARCGAPRRSTAAALAPVRVRVRPRLADRRDRGGLADLLPARGRASAATPPTPASGPRPAATRSPRLRGRSRRCASAGSTPRPPPTSAASRAAPRRTWWPSAARWSWRRAASTTAAPAR